MRIKIISNSSCSVSYSLSSIDDCVLSTVNGQGDILLVVCDGMGGYKRGDFASKLVVDTIKEEFNNHGFFLNKYHAINWIQKIIKRTNKIIFDYAQEKEFKDMGTTVSLVLIFKNKIVTAYAGDSRIYFYNKNKILQISEDQTYVEQLYKAINKVLNKEKKIRKVPAFLVKLAIPFVPYLSKYTLETLQDKSKYDCSKAIKAGYSISPFIKTVEKAVYFQKQRKSSNA